MASRRARIAMVTIPAAIFVGAGALGLAAVHSRPTTTAGGSVNTGTPDYGLAPTYTMTNQLGRQVNSSDLLGRVQIVSFLFPYCHDYCPLIAHNLAQVTRELRAVHLLGSRVVFVAFNVDHTTGPPVMRAFLHQEGIDPASPGWQYLTGPLTELQRVLFSGFHVYFSRESLAAEQRAIAREKANGTYTPGPLTHNPLADLAHVPYDIVHQDLVEIVAPDGHIREIFDPGTNATPQALLRIVEPLAQAPITNVAAPPAVATPPPLAPCPTTVEHGYADLPNMTLRCFGPGSPVHLRGLVGQPTLLNLWASWCAPCRREMPRLERAYQQVGDQLNFLGVDTADTDNAAGSFLAHVHATYPEASDPEDSLRPRLHAPGLPATIVLDASGKVVYRHFGELHWQDLQTALAKVGIHLN